MFEAFSGTADHPGSGLGLPFVAAIVEALGGTVECDSDPAGTTFRVSLPVATLATSAVADGPADASDTPRRTILYIEDSLLNLALVRTTLMRHRDVRILAATRASSGIALAAAQHLDLVLLDVRLPDASAEEVMRTLTVLPGMAEVPIICLSSDDAPGRGAALIELGARAYLRKPLDIAAFLREVDAALGARREEARRR